MLARIGIVKVLVNSLMISFTATEMVSPILMLCSKKCAKALHSADTSGVCYMILRSSFHAISALQKEYAKNTFQLE